MKNYKDVAQSWLIGNFDEETKAEVKHLMETDPVALEDAFYRNLEFGTGGLRGIMGVGTNRMNKYTVGMATQGLANYIKAHVEGAASVCISHDSRNNSRLFAEISADVLSNNGIKVYLFDGLRPTPELSYSIRLKKATAGIMVTASHNPKEYNGYKVFWSDGGQITAPVDKDIVAEVAKIEDPADVRFQPVPGADKAPIEIMGAEVDECYLRDITSLALTPEAVKKHADMKIVYTPLHGCGVRLMPAALNRIGFKNIIHVPEQDVMSGEFPTVGGTPNPELLPTMAMAIAKAEEVQADVAMASDPDADRIAVVIKNTKGKYDLLNGNQIQIIFHYYLMARNAELGLLKGDEYIVKTIVTSELIAKIARAKGIKMYDCYTGFKWIATVMRENEGKGRYLGGGEESYGFLPETFARDKDSVSSIPLMAEIAAWAKDRGMTMNDMLIDVYKTYGYSKELGISVVRKGKSGAEEIVAMMKNFRENPQKEIAGSPVVLIKDFQLLEQKDVKTGEVTKLDMPTTSNVLQYFTEDGTKVSIRPSGTEPKIKFYIEVHDTLDDAANYDAKNEWAEAKLQRIAKDLGIA